jgi:hypothetical protein
MQQGAFPDLRGLGDGGRLRSRPSLQFALENKVFWLGTYGADFYEPLKPREGDVVVGRHRMSDSLRDRARRTPEGERH